jgi:hypothetical protein
MWLVSEREGLDDCWFRLPVAATRPKGETEGEGDWLSQVAGKKEREALEASLLLSSVFSVWSESVALEHLVNVLGVQNSFGPEIKLFGGGFA